MYVQRVLGIPAGQASLLFPAVNLAAIAGALLTPRLLGWLGARRSLLAGFAAIAAGITLLVALPPQGLPVVAAGGVRIHRHRHKYRIGRVDPDRNRCGGPGLSRRGFGGTYLCLAGWDGRRRRPSDTDCGGPRMALSHDGLSHWLPRSVRGRARRCLQQLLGTGSSGF
jgi:MFS family permease